MIDDVVAPEGMRHVGWHCDHTDRATTHMDPKWSKKKQAWKLKERPEVLVYFAGLTMFRGDLICPHAKPMFVGEAAA